jgi:hypothetical protein
MKDVNWHCDLMQDIIWRLLEHFLDRTVVIVPHVGRQGFLAWKQTMPECLDRV